MVGPDGASRLDNDTARRIADRFGLNHESLVITTATAAQREEWLKLTSLSLGGQIHRYFATIHQLDPMRPVLPGMAGEVARAFYWKKLGRDRAPLSPRTLLHRTGMGDMTEFLPRAESWLSEVSRYDVHTILDLLYIEMRLGCWASPAQYGNFWSVYQLFPLCHRRILERMMSLPVDFRRRRRLPEEVIRHRWPELLEIPFPTYRGFDRIVGKLLKRR
jgi:hypothetical protein